MTTETAQRRLLEVLASMHHKRDDIGASSDGLAAFIAGLQTGRDLYAAEEPAISEAFGAFADLAMAVWSDLKETTP